MMNTIELSQSIRSVVTSVVEDHLHLITRGRRWPGSRAETWAIVPVYKWPAIPGRKGIHFLDRAAEWVAQAGQELGYSECIAVALAEGGTPTGAYSFPMTAEGVMEFSWHCAGVPHLLTTEDGAFAILCTTSNYNIIGGPHAFVRTSIGASIDAMRTDFQWAAGSKDGELGTLLQSISDCYEGVDGVSITQVIDPDQISRLHSLLEDVIEEEIHISRQWIEANNWAVVPIESYTLPSSAAIEWLVEAARMMKCDHLWGIPTERDSMGIYRVGTEVDEIGSFYKVCWGFHYALLAEDRSCMVLYTMDDYGLIAGPAEFVRHAVGASIEASRREFLERYVDIAAGSFDGVRNFLVNVAKRYEGYNG